MPSATVHILYTPLKITFSVVEIGGSVEQKKDLLTGAFDPDRTLFPFVLRPQLVIQDPDHVLADGDHTQSLIDCRWFIGNDDTGERITEDTEGFTLGDFGELQVGRNIDPAQPMPLYFSCAYIDQRTGNTFRQSYSTMLSTSQATELKLAIEIDAADKMVISPFRTNAQRTITATLINGINLVPDDKAVYEWMVLDSGDFRPIADDDVFYVSGKNSKSLTIDRRYIDKELIRIVASHISAPDKPVYAQTKAYRSYGQYSKDLRITRGKFIKFGSSSTGNQIDLLAVVTSPKGNIANLADYFDITHTFVTNQVGDTRKVIGYGETLSVPSSIAGTDPHVLPIFFTSIRERTALRVCRIDGQTVTIDDQPVCIAIPILTVTDD
jgi:hypothetical protein